MEIKSISQKIFKTNTANVENNSRHTNPFGVNFKGNMINADVFEPSFEGKATLAQKAANRISGVKNKLADAMNVGSITSFVTRARDFGKKITDGAARLWDTAKSIEINIDLPKAFENISEKRAYKVNNLVDNHESKKLGDMWQELLASA